MSSYLHASTTTSQAIMYEHSQIQVILAKCNTIKFYWCIHTKDIHNLPTEVIKSSLIKRWDNSYLSSTTDGAHLGGQFKKERVLI